MLKKRGTGAFYYTGALEAGMREEFRFRARRARLASCAALSLDGLGLQSYGECSLVLREELIAHRASVFEDNPAVFLRDRSYQLSPGHRATWEDRPRLGVAKLAPAIRAGTSPADFPALLVQQGAASEEDRFIEVHIWGSISARTCQCAILISKGGKVNQAFRKALRARLAALGVELEVR